MYKILKHKEDIDKLVESYFWIDNPDHFLRALHNFSDINSHGYGTGVFFVQFSTYHEPWEEYYIGDNKVSFIGEPPAYDEDVMVIMDYKEFFSYVVLYSEKYIKEHPEDQERVGNYLIRIKNRLGLDTITKE